MGLFNKKTNDKKNTLNEINENEELIKKVVSKLEEIGKYNEDVKNGMDGARMEISLYADIFNGELETVIKNIKFIDDDGRHSVLTIGKYSLHYFNGEYFKRIFAYDGWEDFLKI